MQQQQEEEKEYLEVILSLDPGWINLGWILTAYSPISGNLYVFRGTHNTRIPPKCGDPVCYVIGISEFMKTRVLEKIRCVLAKEEEEKLSGKWRAIALIIEQQPKKRKKYTKHELLQQMLESVGFTYFARQDSVNGRNFLIHRFCAVTTKKVFGVWRKGASYSERKLEMLERVNQLAEGPPIEKDKFPLIISVKTDHEADALAGLNVYINRTHNHDLYDVGIYKKRDTPKRQTRKRGRPKQQQLDGIQNSTTEDKEIDSSNTSKESKIRRRRRRRTTSKQENKD